MEAKVAKKIILKLELEEAFWLEQKLQNPLCEDEHPEDAEIRRDFFEKLSRVL